MPSPVVYVLWRYPQVSQTFVRNEIAGLRELGQPVEVLSVAGGDSEHIDGDWAGDHRSFERATTRGALADHLWFLTHRPRGYLRYVGALLRFRQHVRYGLKRVPTTARRLVREAEPKGVHAHFAWSSSVHAVYLARMLEIPASITLHAKDIYTARPATLRTLLAHFDRMVTICHFNVGFLQGMQAVPATSDIRVVPCGVEIPAQTSGVDDPRFDVVSVGRLVDKKGFDLLLRALAQVRNEHPDVRALIVGAGPSEQQLLALRRELGLEEVVTFAGAQAHADTLDSIARARVFCLAARPAADGDVDGMPVVLREAMARAVPVVATRVTGIPESIDNEVGWLIAPEDPDALACALREALADPAATARRGEAGRARVQAHWSLERQARDMLEVLGAD